MPLIVFKQKKKHTHEEQKRQLNKEKSQSNINYLLFFSLGFATEMIEIREIQRKV